MRILTRVSLSSFLCFTCQAALAADDAGPETVVVSATRTPQPLDATGESVSIISANDLDLEQSVSLSDVLKETPGVDISRAGGVGQISDISIRGSTPGQVLMLVDGIRINDPSEPDGQAVLSDLLVNDIARVEILRGPQSTLYGSQAIGGVVDVITDIGNEGFAARATAEGGSFGTYRFNAAANGSYDVVDYGAAANFLSTTGISSAANPPAGAGGPNGYRNAGATFNTRTHLSDAVSIDLRGYFTDSKTGFDGYPPPNYVLQHDGEFGTNRLAAGYAGVNVSLLDGTFLNRFAITGSASNDKDYGQFDPVTYAFSPALNFYGRGSSTRVEYQGIYALAPKSQLTFGVENENTTLNTASPTPGFPLAPTRGHIGIASGYAQIQTETWDGVTLTGGVRDDNHERFGNHVSYKFAGAWQLFKGQTVLRANFGDGFKEPTLYQLYSQYSNPVRKLAPETANGWEAGIDNYVWDKRVRLSGTYFSRRTDDQIEFVPCFTANTTACTLRPIGYYDNVARSEASGIELEAAAQIVAGLSLTANYTYLNANDLASRSVLLRQPHDSAFVRLAWIPAEKWSLAASLAFTGASFDQPEDVGHLGAYTLVNLYASYDLTQQLEVYARIENLFDMRYEQELGYAAPGRAAYAGLRAHI